jgi:prepilin-type N-terminal cleavage/methylation domain-containing protein
MKDLPINTRKTASGFTLVEMMVSLAIVTVVIAGTLSLFVSFLRSYNATTLMRNTSSRASLALERMVYGVGGNAGLREAVANTASATYSAGGWKLSYTNSTGTLFFQYTPNTLSIVDQSGKTICTNVLASTMTKYAKGCQISLSVSESAGGRTLTNSMTSFVQFRN